MNEVEALKKLAEESKRVMRTLRMRDERVGNTIERPLAWVAVASGVVSIALALPGLQAWGFLTEPMSEALSAIQTVLP